MQRIQSEICGAIETPSLSHAVYFITFINDFSHKSWVYFLKHKSETFGIFQDFKSMVEKEYGESIKILKTNNGGELTKNEYYAYLFEHGIQH